MEAIGKIVSALVIVIVSVFLSGWALSTAWGWIIVPGFSVSPISIPVAMGVALIIRFTTMQSASSEKTVDMWATMVQSIVIPLIFVGLSWCVKFFI